jgi:hypothetical protein
VSGKGQASAGKDKRERERKSVRLRGKASNAPSFPLTVLFPRLRFFFPAHAVGFPLTLLVSRSRFSYPHKLQSRCPSRSSP